MRYEKLLPFYHLLWKHWREKRYQMFHELMAPQPIERLLDVGAVRAIGLAGWKQCVRWIA